MKFGAHVSIAGGINNSPSRAHALGCECFQIFSRSPRGGKAPVLSDELVESFFNECNKCNIKEYYIHTPYYINLCSEKEDLRRSSITIIKEELERGDILNVKYAMTHLGSSKGVNREKSILKIGDSLKRIMDSVDSSTQLLLENSAGQGATIGDSFEELAKILDIVSDYNIGVCLDTAHMFAAGYDIRDGQLSKTIDKIRKTIGIENVKLLHGNDSKVGLGERKDRHEHIGKGKIGIEGFRNIVQSPVFKNINMIVETPPSKVGEDIKILKSLRNS
jgi:deoxyribonuclease-4